MHVASTKERGFFLILLCTFIGLVLTDDCNGKISSMEKVILAQNENLAAFNRTIVTLEMRIKELEENKQNQKLGKSP